MPAKTRTPDEITDIATIADAPTTVAEVDDIVWEDDGVNPEKVRAIFPQIKLIQGTTRGVEARDTGRFLHSDTGQIEDAIEVIPLIATDQRSFFEEGVDAPACVSYDGIRPAPNQPLWTKPVVAIRGKGMVSQEGLWQPRFCAECRYSQFGPNGEAPDCNESILLMVQRQDEDESLAQFRVGRTGLSIVRREMGKLKGMAGRPPIFTRLWTFGSASVEKNGKKWQQLTVKTTPLERSHAISINNLVKTMRSTMQREAQSSIITDGDDANIIDVEVPDYE